MAAARATKWQLEQIEEIAKAKPQAYKAYIRRWAYQRKRELTRNQCEQVISSLGATSSTASTSKRVSPEVLERRQKHKTWLKTLETKKNFLDL